MGLCTMKRAPIRLVQAPPAAPTAVARFDDAGSLARVACGDIGALSELYDRHARALLRFATRCVGASDAEDLVQSTFIRAASAAATFDGRSPSARSWLFGITARLIQERRRSVTRFARALLRMTTFDTGVLASGERRDLEKGLLLLSDAKRTVLVLAEVENFSCEEIATMLDVPVGTVWTRLHHARKEMRAFYEATPR